MPPVNGGNEESKADLGNCSEVERFRHFKQNTGTGGVVRTVALVVFSIGFCLFYPTKIVALPVVLGGLLLPAVLQKSFADAPQTWSKILRIFFYALFVVALIGPQLKDSLPDPESYVIGLWGLLALYTGLFFWFWSHPDIVKAEG